MQKRNNKHGNLWHIFNEDQKKNPMPQEKVEEMMEKLGLLLACREGICPLCGGNIDYGSFNLVDEGGTYDWECPGCGATGKEGYDLVFDGNHYDVRRADGTEVDLSAIQSKENRV